MPNDPFFGPQHLPDSGEEVFVGWIDLMGVGDAMSRSYKSAATNIGKLFSAVANHRFNDNITVYPMVDGMYILSNEDAEADDATNVPTVMSNIFRQFGNLTHMRNDSPTDDYGPWLGFLIRGGVAQGEVYHGEEVDEDGESDLANIDWLDNVPFGKPIANAHNIERGLSPYGIGLHESVTEDPRSWRWWETYDDDTRDNIVSYLNSHFEWCLGNIDSLTYEEDRLYVHMDRAEEYFDLPEGHFDT